MQPAPEVRSPCFAILSYNKQRKKSIHSYRYSKNMVKMDTTKVVFVQPIVTFFRLLPSYPNLKFPLRFRRDILTWSGCPETGLVPKRLIRSCRHLRKRPPPGFSARGMPPAETLPARPRPAPLRGIILNVSAAPAEDPSSDLSRRRRRGSAQGPGGRRGTSAAARR